MQSVGILGGTGKQGRGLALRLALAGHPVTIGSRAPERAADAADGVAARSDELARSGHAPASAVGGVDSGDYAAAGAADVVVVAVPFDGLDAAVAPLATALSGRVVVSCISPVAIDDDGPHPVPVAEGSAAERVQRLAPEARVAAAFQNVAARKLLDAPAAVGGDVLVTGDDVSARSTAAELTRGIPDLRPVDVGPLRLSRPVEELTAVQMAVNRAHKVVTAVQLRGLPD